MAEQAKKGGGVIYRGYRINGEAQVRREEITAEGSTVIDDLDPAPSRALYDHSEGFEWGYFGSGPAQLALALLLDAVDDREVALEYHQDFKERFVATWRAAWQLNAAQVRAWVEQKKLYAHIREEMGKQESHE